MGLFARRAALGLGGTPMSGTIPSLPARSTTSTTTVRASRGQGRSLTTATAPTTSQAARPLIGLVVCRGRGLRVRRRSVLVEVSSPASRQGDLKGAVRCQVAALEGVSLAGKAA